MEGRLLGPLAVLALVAAGGACAPPPPEPFGLAEARRAGEALERLPAGVAAFRAGDYDRAAAVFAGVRETLPDPSRAATAAVLLHLDGGAPAYRRLLSSLENNLGMAHSRARRFAAAEEALERAVRADPGSWRALVNLGLARTHRRRFPAAVESFRTARRAGCDTVELHLELGKAARRAGWADEARDSLEAARVRAGREGTVEAWGDAIQAEYELAMLDVDAGRLASAVARLEALLERSPGMAEARYELARTLARAGRHDAAAAHRRRFDEDSEAVARVQAILAADPGRVDALHTVAATYDRLGLLHLSAVHYRQLLARDPGDEVAADALRALQARVRGGALGDGR